MTFIYSLLYIAFISATAVGFISSTADGGDFLNIGLTPLTWGFATAVTAALAVVAHVKMFASLSDRSSGLMIFLTGALYAAHGLTLLASLVPAALVAMAVLAGGGHVGHIAALVAVVILAIPYTPMCWSLIREMNAHT
ncbi:hypothetical protein [Leisingera caerulea]|uniref:hypothetical protein n=1 Tax=Leisingera caerulea TaxID=506591 RepID=UPI000401A187|nr:hypothetical protein [Leisingera caerulea]